MELNPAQLAQQIAQHLKDSGYVAPAFTDTKGAASYLSLSASTLERLRVEGGGPPWTKLAKAVRYRYDLLDEWSASLTQTATCQEKPNG